MLEIIPLLIPILALSIPIFAIWTRHQAKLEAMRLQASREIHSESAAQHASHTRELEERVRVLERIITDRGFDVATQIEALRDSRADARLEAPHQKGDL